MVELRNLSHPASQLPDAMPAAPGLLDALGHSMADKRLEVLRRLAHNGSISQAGRDCGISYKAAWQALDTLTNLAGVTLVERSVGGAGGGGATLTDAGHALLRAADAMEQARAQVLARLRGAGLQQPVLARLAVRTSMRNQWPCTVQSLHRDGGRVTVHLETASTQAVSLQAQVTQESAELLGLSPGQAVLAMVKATAVQITTQLRTQPAQGTSLWQGEVLRADVDGGLELAVRLTGGIHVVGFANAQPLPVPGAAVQVLIPAAAVVLALVDETGLNVA